MEEPQGVGFNAATGEYMPMIENGIVDPLKVTRSASAERGIRSSHLPDHRGRRDRSGNRGISGTEGTEPLKLIELTEGIYEKR